MEPVLVAELLLIEKYIDWLRAEIGNQENQVRQANRLLDRILICINAHLNNLSGHPLNDTVQAIAHEIIRYKGCPENLMVD